MHAMSGIVRPAVPQDAAACLAIHRPYVENTAISWEIEVPTVDEMASRIDGLRATHEWLVLERGDQIVGFAYGQPLKRLASFRWSAETGIYIDVAHHRTGGGRDLYTRLRTALLESCLARVDGSRLSPEIVAGVAGGDRGVLPSVPSGLMTVAL